MSTSSEQADALALGRPQRADARRNHDRVLAAASAAFAADGLEAQVPDIARRAGVGVGTVYRHFPTKEALVAALARSHFETMTRLAEARLAAPGPAWDRFSGLMWASARAFVEDRGLAEIAASRPEVMQTAAAERDRLLAVAGELIAAARAEGDMRADASARDVPTIMCGLGRVASIQHCGAPVSWERYLELMLDGLRAR